MSIKIETSNLNNLQTQRKFDKYKDVPSEIMEVAQGMESQFINHMLNELRKTAKSEEQQGPAIEFYNAMMDQEYSKIMSETDNGIGLKDMIIEQLAPQSVNQHTSTRLEGLKTYQKQEVDSTKGGSHE